MWRCYIEMEQVPVCARHHGFSLCRQPLITTVCAWFCFFAVLTIVIAVLTSPPGDTLTYGTLQLGAIVGLVFAAVGLSLWVACRFTKVRNFADDLSSRLTTTVERIKPQ